MDNAFVSVTQLVLGSTSPFRRKLLEDAGLTVTTASPAVDEDAISHPQPAGLALARAEAKARAVAERHPGALIIGADQVLEFAGLPLGKVATAELAQALLGRMAGHTHELHTAFALALAPRAGAEVRILHGEIVTVAMPMRALQAEDIAAYVATGEWQGSCGCYQYEHRGVHLFERVRADQSAIIGLPMPELLSALRRLGVDTLRAPTPPWRVGPLSEA